MKFTVDAIDKLMRKPLEKDDVVVTGDVPGRLFRMRRVAKGKRNAYWLCDFPVGDAATDAAGASISRTADSPQRMSRRRVSKSRNSTPNHAWGRPQAEKESSPRRAVDTFEARVQSYLAFKRRGTSRCARWRRSSGT